MSRFNFSNIKMIYLYTVSFATLLMIIFAAVGVAQAAIGLVFPQPDYSPGPLEIRSRYQAMLKESQAPEAISEELVRQQVEFETERNRRNMLYQRMRDLAGDVAMLAVAVPIYICHWRRAQKEPKEQNVE